MFDTLTDLLAAAGVGDPAAMRELRPSALVTAVRSAYRLESMLVARRLAAVAALLKHRVAAAGQANTDSAYVVIDAEEVRQLAAAASLRLADFQITPQDALRYQPSAVVTARDPLP
jgi:hypothetical protein